MNGAGGTLRLLAWGCAGVVALLSLLPADEMVRTDWGGHVEHATAYAGLTALVRLAYPVPRLGRIVAALVAYAGLLELLQNFSPGRTPAVGDWLASSSGVLIGTALACWAGFVMARRRNGLP